MKRFFHIFAIIALAFGFVACEVNETTENKEYKVELSADTASILADGEDSATFTIKVDGKATSEDVMIICLNDNSVLEGTTFKTDTAGKYSFKAAYKGFTSETVTIIAVDGEPNISVVLKADKSEIKADSTDTVTFTVEVDGEDKSSEVKITVINYNSELESNTFTTDVAGEFVFVANYEGVKSNEVKVVATAVEVPVQKSLTIEASKLRIKADGEDCATFTVMYGEEDVTATCEIRTTAGDVIENGVFATTTPGSYGIYALYDNVRSNTVSIDAYDPNFTSAYEIGQIYEVNGAKGVAYAIKTDRQNRTWAYFFSMDEADLQWSTENVWCNCISDKGSWNTYDPFDANYSQADGGVRDINNYPAFKWCMDHGDGWFMPSSDELQWMWDAISEGTHNFNYASVAAYNKLLTDNGGIPFVETYYWSSNETSEDMVELIAFMSDSIVCLEPFKTSVYTVRAATRVQLN